MPQSQSNCQMVDQIQIDLTREPKTGAAQNLTHKER